MSKEKPTIAAGGRLSAFGNVKLKTKILGGFLPVLGVLAIVGGTGYWSLAQVEDQFGTYSQRVGVGTMVSEIEKQVLDVRRVARDFGYTANEKALVKARDIATVIKSDIEKAVAEIHNPERHQKMQDIAGAFDSWLKHFEEVVALKTGQADHLKNELDPVGPATADALEALAAKAAQGGSSDLSILANQALFHVMEARLYVNMALGRHDAGISEKAELAFENIGKVLKQMQASIGAAPFKAQLDEIVALTDKYRHAAEAAEKADNEILELLNTTMLESGTQISEDAAAIRESTEAEESQIRGETDALLSMSSKLMLIVGFVGIAVGALLAWLLGGAIAKPIIGMAGAMKKIADSDFAITIPGLGKKDEIGEMADALSALRDVSVEAARAKSVLENAATNVMVADNDGKIVFLNKTVTAMLKNAEQDIRKDLPRFDANNLVGRSIDEFHKNPAHQRGMLANLSGTYRAQIKIGGRSFGLVANPAIDSRGHRVGTGVEWTDMTQELAVQDEVAHLVNAVATGDLTKRLSLEGKVGFMKSLSEGINQVTDTVAKAVGEVVTVMSSMARGDLSKRISGDYQGEFLKLKDDANATAEKLAEIVGQTVEGMANIKASTTEISSGATDLSSRTEEQVASLEEIAASIRQLNTTVQQSAENAGQASQLALAARSAAESGGEVAGSAVKAMSEIEQSSQKISDIVGMIDEIAFQTNLLALNAAVEAARAGEAGRGFAVVAGEVRALAQRSSQASKEIKALITNSNSQVKQGVELVNKAGATLGEIVTSVKRVSDIVAEIAAANKEQSASVGEVQEAVGQIEQATQQNAALVEETTAALGSADNQVQTVTDVIAFFKSDAAMAPARPAAAAAPAKGAKAVQAKLASKVSAPAKPAPKKVAATGTDDGWEEF